MQNKERNNENLKHFEVFIEEVLYKKIDVFAKSKEDAIKKVENQYCDEGSIYLTYDDYCGESKIFIND